MRPGRLLPPRDGPLGPVDRPLVVLFTAGREPIPVEAPDEPRSRPERDGGSKLSWSKVILVTLGLVGDGGPR